MKLEDYQELLYFRRQAEFFQGKDLQSLGWWPGKQDFTLCPEMWFWAYNADNIMYPDLMMVSFTPFWSKGQAEIDLSVKVDRCERKISSLQQEVKDED